MLFELAYKVPDSFKAAGSSQGLSKGPESDPETTDKKISPPYLELKHLHIQRFISPFSPHSIRANAAKGAHYVSSSS